MHTDCGLGTNLTQLSPSLVRLAQEDNARLKQEGKPGTREGIHKPEMMKVRGNELLISPRDRTSHALSRGEIGIFCILLHAHACEGKGLQGTKLGRRDSSAWPILLQLRLCAPSGLAFGFVPCLGQGSTRRLGPASLPPWPMQCLVLPHCTQALVWSGLMRCPAISL